MTDSHATSSLLRVASPYVRNTQQRGQSAQHVAQQVAPLPSLKALAVAALALNNPCNNDATRPEGARNNAPGIEDDLLHVIRTRLLHLAEAEGLPASVVDTIPNDELDLYAELADADLLPPLHLRARCSLCGGKDRHHDHPEAA